MRRIDSGEPPSRQSPSGAVRWPTTWPWILTVTGEHRCAQNGLGTITTAPPQSDSDGAPIATSEAPSGANAAPPPPLGRPGRGTRGAPRRRAAGPGARRGERPAQRAVRQLDARLRAGAVEREARSVVGPAGRRRHAPVGGDAAAEPRDRREEA